MANSLHKAQEIWLRAEACALGISLRSFEMTHPYLTRAIGILIVTACFACNAENHSGSSSSLQEQGRPSSAATKKIAILDLEKASSEFVFPNSGDEMFYTFAKGKRSVGFFRDAKAEPDEALKIWRDNGGCLVRKKSEYRRPERLSDSSIYSVSEPTCNLAGTYRYLRGAQVGKLTVVRFEGYDTRDNAAVTISCELLHQELSKVSNETLQAIFQEHIRLPKFEVNCGRYIGTVD